MKTQKILKNVKNTYKLKRCFDRGFCKNLLHQKNLPILAYLVGKVMGDGHLSNIYGLKFSNPNQEDLKDLFILLSEKLSIGGTKMRTYKKISKGVCYSLCFGSALLARTLFCLGAPKGNKTKQKFLIPDWILKNQKYKKMFLMAILEDELSTIKIEKKNHSIEPKFKMAKRESIIEDLRSFLQQVKECIESFGVECSDVSQHPKGNEPHTKELYFHIKRNKRNIIKYEEEIGFFLNQDKKIKLKECCEILRKTLMPEVDKEEIFRLRKQGLTMRQIASRIYHHRTTVHRVLQQQNDSSENLKFQEVPLIGYGAAF